MHQLHALILNLLLVILLSAVGSYVSLTARKKQYWGLLGGAVFGLCVILIIGTPLVVGQGWIMDYRSVLMTLAGYAGGASDALIAGIFGICYRLWIGGIGSTAGALSIVTYGLLGVVLKHYLPFKKLANPLVSVALGIVLAGINLAFLAGGIFSNAERIRMAQDLAPTTLLFTPLATYGSFWLFCFLTHHIRNYTALNAAFEVAPTHALVLTQAGNIVMSTSGLESHPELQGAVVSYLKATSFAPHDSSDVVPQEMPIKVAGGQVYFLLSMGSTLLPSGKVGSVAILEDITEYKQESTQHDRFFDLSPDVLVVFGSDGLIRRTNKPLTAMLGYEQETLMAMAMADLIHPDDLPVAQEAWQACMASKVPLDNLENRFMAADGSLRWLAWSVVPVAQEQAIYALVRDITEQRQERKALEDQASQLRDQLELLELAHDSIIVRQIDDTITFWNRGAEKNYGWSKQEALGANYHELLHSEYGT
ncbi:MAG: PAS domain S-box protein, partial [Bacillota bacterium]|nr:PAS domain S-box protein [Bacillota bacterium]